MKKRYIIIAIAVIALLIGLGVFLSFWLEQNTQKDVLARSKEFAAKWGNFSDEISDEYFDSIAPYVSSDVLDEYKSSIDEIKEARGTNEPIRSTFKVGGEPTLAKKGRGYDTIIEGSRSYSINNKAYDQKIYMHWEKIRGKYLITEVYTDK